jgi:hypothetical protein
MSVTLTTTTMACSTETILRYSTRPYAATSTLIPVMTAPTQDRTAEAGARSTMD